MEHEGSARQGVREAGRVLPLSVGAVLMGLVLVVVSVWMARLDQSGVPGGAVPLPPSGAQSDYVLSVRQDQQSLDRGVLVHTAIGGLDVGDEAEFSVKVFDLGKGTDAPAGVAPALPPGVVAAPDNVPTGGDLGVTLICEHIACTPYDAERKPVVGKGASATWTFGLTAHEPGTARLHIVAEVYRGDTDQVLVGAEPVDLDVDIRRTWSYTARQAGHWLVATAPGLGLCSGGALAGVAGALWRRLRARRRTEALPAAEVEPAVLERSAG
ncbi:hypothetical protein ABT095_04050 [Kitasatospora sp. NPDC002227]|uniref:hypothetical protein n=1 Tax=Kitasatospora sp. NPDC002227 TaxID=3154773 RepID=UPI00332FED63